MVSCPCDSHTFRPQVTLDSLIPSRMPFVKANAIFHHWKIDDHRMGLAFNGTADARSFDRGIRVALENLEKGELPLLRFAFTQLLFVFSHIASVDYVSLWATNLLITGVTLRAMAKNAERGCEVKFPVV